MKFLRTRTLTFNEQQQPTQILHGTLALMTNPDIVYTSGDPNHVRRHLVEDHKFVSYPSLAQASPDIQYRLLESMNTNNPEVSYLIMSVFDRKVLERDFHHFGQNLELYHRQVFGASEQKVGFKSLKFFPSTFKT